MLEPGSRIGDSEVLGVLGRGHSAITYLARHVSDGREVAVKVPHAIHLSDSTFVSRFLREGALGSKLSHRSIVRVIDVGEDRGRLYIAMELAEGRTLSFELEGRRPLPLLRGLNVAREVADALAHAHANGVAHRDLRPGHIMLVPGGGVKVMDFGVARAFGEAGLTSPDVFLGTPQYSPPEGEDPRALDHLSDLYSLGIVLFKMLQGHPPFESQDPVAVMIMHREQPLPGPEELTIPVPREVWELMSWLCRKDPAKRPQSAAQVVDELDRSIEMVSVGSAE